MQSDKEIYLAVYMITYNQENFIEKAIESVLLQNTKFNYKLFIGDDCSTDQTYRLCKLYKKKYPDKIDVISRKENIGAKKNGIEIFYKCFKSGAKYIAILEGDDYWTDPLKLQKQVDFLENHPDYSLCFHKVQILKKNSELVDDYITKVPDNYETIETLVRQGNYIHTPSVVFRNLITNLPFEFQQVPFGDFFLYFIMAHHGKLKYLDEDMAVYRSGIGLISKMTERTMNANYVKLYSCMLSFTTDVELKKIIIDKQQEVLKSYTILFDSEYWSLKNEFKSAFVSHHKLFKGIKYLQNKYWKLKLKKKPN